MRIVNNVTVLIADWQTRLPEIFRVQFGGMMLTDQEDV